LVPKFRSNQDLQYRGTSTARRTLDELLEFDYDQPVEDRRCTAQTGPTVSWDPEICEPGSSRRLSERSGAMFGEAVDAVLSAMAVAEGHCRFTAQVAGT
jgi:hypothetical protein